MPDTFVQDILDPEELQKRDAWNKRLKLPILVNLDNYFRSKRSTDTILSGEYVHKINPENYLVKDGDTSPGAIRYLGVDGQNIPQDINPDNLEQIKNGNYFFPIVCLLVDGTGKRNDSEDAVLPKELFVLNRKKYSDSNLFSANIKTLVEIAFGDKGIGLRSRLQDFGFSKDHPFYIFVSSLNDDELRKYMDEVLNIISKLDDERIKTVGFLAPKVG